MQPTRPVTAGEDDDRDPEVIKKLAELDDEAAKTTGNLGAAGMREMDFRTTVESFRKFFYQQKKVRDTEQAKANMKRQPKVFSEETLKGNLDNVSSNYEVEFIEAGFPPKICAQMVTKLCNVNPFNTMVLEVGCGKGFAGEYLKEEGFHNVYGVDCSYNLLSIAEEKKTYKKLERMVVGQEGVDIPENYHGAFEFVMVPSMINNGGFDMKVFKDVLLCLKVGGYAIFATKLNFKKQDIYEEVVKELSDLGCWKFTAQHQFYRYDKLCGNMGQFSNKLVKVVAYQKTADWKEPVPEEEKVPEAADAPDEEAQEESPKKKKKKSTAKIA